MRTLVLAAALLMALAIGASTAQAAVPREINYQGFLTDPGGTPINAPVNLVFKLYMAPGAGLEIYSETQNSVPVTNGVFNVLIGSVTPIPGSVLFDQPYYLGVKVGADAEMTPRQLVAASAYALRSATTDAVGSTTAANVATAANLANAATAGNTGGAIVLRDGSGNFSAQTITVAGDLNMSATNAAGTVGVINQGGSPLIHTRGSLNFFAGGSAGNLGITGIRNTALGALALANNIGGSDNTAIGMQAATGNLGGSSNIAVGFRAGFLINGDNNIAIGNPGVTGEANAIRLGDPAVHTKTVLAGNIGIGTASPVVKLHVSPGTAKTDPASTRAFAILTNEPLGANGDPNNPFGLDVRLSGGATNADRAVHLQSTNFNTADGGSILLQPFGGVVGIGTTTPTRAKLEIVGFQSAALPGTNGFYGMSASGYTFPPSSLPYSLYAESNIAALGLVAFSDARIKRSAGRSDAARDLALLAGIEVTDYTYIDTASKGTGTHKKVIAQQLEKVYTQAVTRSTDVVPDIYQKAETKDGWVSLQTNLRKGERVRLIGRGKEGVHEVLEVAPGRFRTAFAAEGGMVFVYGREVNDFRSVDYEAIAMLNVSATQELNRRLEAQAMEVAALKQQVAELLAATLAGPRLAAAR